MPVYDNALFSPSAPVASVTLRNPNTGVTLADVPMLIDSGAENLAAIRPFVVQPEGRVHFAGEHASSAPAWMQGALESGNRVAQEISG